MSSEPSSPMVKMRKFNRFYTNVLGLLDRHLLDTEFSLTEARILYELGEQPSCSASDLKQKLKMDAGYLSRIVKSFEKRGLAVRVQSKADARFFPIQLTEKGRETLLHMNKLSDNQSESLIAALSETQRNELLDSMGLIQRYLSGEPGQPVLIRHGLKPGDAGALIQMHGWIYEKECGYNHVFEGYVCKTLFDFLTEYSPHKDRIWFATAGERLVGAIAIVGHPNETAQLRWFILHPDFRGQGIGKQLMKGAIGFAQEAGYKELFLETTDDQETAIAMYKKAGFVKTSEKAAAAWGVCHTEQIYKLSLC